MVQLTTSVVVAALLAAPALAAPVVGHEHHARPGVGHIARREPHSRAALRQQQARDLEEMEDLLARFHGMGHEGMSRLHARNDKKKDDKKRDDKKKDDKKKDDKKKGDKKKDEHKKDDKKKEEHKKDEHKKEEHKQDAHKKEEHKADAKPQHSPAVEHQQATEAPETPEPTAEAEEAPALEAQEEAEAIDEHADLNARGQRGRGSLRAGGLAQVFKRELCDVEEFSARDWEELEELAARSPFLGKIVRKVKGIFKGKGAAKGAQAGAEVHAATQPAERDLESVEELALRAYFNSEFDEFD